MTQPTYELQIDLDGDEVFEGGSEDVTADVLLRGLRTTRGHDVASSLFPSRAGSLGFTLDNAGGGYDAGGTLTQGLWCRLRATHPTGGAVYDLYRGQIAGVVQTALNEFGGRVQVDTLGTLSLLTKAGPSTLLYQSITTGAAIDHTLDAAGFRRNLEDYANTDIGNVAWHYRMGEASGDIVDQSGNGNDGTVTIGVGVRGEPALDDSGETDTNAGAVEFDGADTKVEVTDAAAIQNIFDGGGAVFFSFNADSDGESDQGRIANKRTGVGFGSGWDLLVRNEASSKLVIEFFQLFSGDNGDWRTAADVPINVAVFGVVTYDADAVGNKPTIYLYDPTNGFRTLTVGDGLTEFETPTGTRSSDATAALVIGNITDQTRTFDGHIGRNIGFSASVTAAQAKAMITRALDAPRHIAVGDGTLAWWWLDAKTAPLRELNTIVNAEGPDAEMYEDPTGAIVFRDAGARTTDARSTAVQSTFRGSGAAPLIDRLDSYSDGARDIVNSVTLERVERRVEELPVLVGVKGVNGSGTSQVVDISDAQPDDIVIAWVTATDPSNWPAIGTPSGWATIETQTGVFDTNLNAEIETMWYQVPAEGFMGTVTFTSAYGVLRVVTGYVRGGSLVANPIDDSTEGYVTWEDPTIPEVTTTEEHVLCLASGWLHYSGAGPYDFDGTALAGWTEEPAAAIQADFTLWKKVVATASAVGDQTLTVDVGADMLVNMIAVKPRRVGVIWSISEDLVLANDETRVLTCRASDGSPFTAAVAPTVAGLDYIVEAGGLASAITLDRTSGSTIQMTIVAGASGATLSGLRLRAELAAVRSRTAVTASSGDADKPLGAYPVRAELSLADMQTLADSLVTKLATARPRATFTVLGNTGDAELTACLAREVGDRVRLIEDRVGIDLTGHIEQIKHEIARGRGRMHRTTFTIRKVP